MRAASDSVAPSLSTAEVADVAEWIKRTFERRQVGSLSLGQRRSTDGAVSAIASWIDEDFETLDIPNGLAEAIVELALLDAETQRGTVRYVVEGFSPGESTAFAKYSFRLAGAAGTRLMPAIVAVIGDRLTEERVQAIAEKLSGSDRTEFLETVRQHQEERQGKLVQFEAYRAIFDAFEFTDEDVQRIACELGEPLDGEFQAAAEHFGKSRKSQ